MEKVFRNGKVAVLYSPEFGAGWYSWNKEHEACLFDPEIVSLVEQLPKNGSKRTEKISEIEKIAESKWDSEERSFYSGGAHDLCIAWVDEGSLIKIREYDGSESIEIMDPQNGWIRV